MTDEDGNVVRLNLGSNDLNGEIPSDIKLLEHLRVLDLSFNGKSGVPYRLRSERWKT